MTNRPLSRIVKSQKPLVLPAGDSVRAACRAMLERRAGSVLVVDGSNRLVGIFTGRDAVRTLAAGKDDAATPLTKAMTRQPVTIGPQDRAIDALRAMSQGGFRHVPVIADGAVLGVVSRGDLKGMELDEFLARSAVEASGGAAKRAANREVKAIVAQQSPLVMAADATVQDACRSMWKRKSGSTVVVDGRGRLAGIFTGRDAVRVLATARRPAATRLARAMSRNPVTIPADSRAIDALRLMNDGGFRHLPVVDGGKPLGVVSRSDFTGIEIDRLEQEVHLWECIW